MCKKFMPRAIPFIMWIRCDQSNGAELVLATPPGCNIDHNEPLFNVIRAVVIFILVHDRLL